jgi:hypothetical protein
MTVNADRPPDLDGSLLLIPGISFVASNATIRILTLTKAVDLASIFDPATTRKEQMAEIIVIERGRYERNYVDTADGLVSVCARWRMLLLPAFRLLAF